MSQNSTILAARRIYALIFRTVSLMVNSMPRLFEAMYWPTLNMLMMGFMTSYLMKAMGMQELSFHVILGATILLELFLRAGVSMLLTFVEEIYSRNIAQLYASPLRGHEQVIAYVVLMLLRLAIGLFPAVIFCALIFGYSLFSLGLWLAPFALILVTSGLAWGLMLICLLLRFGQSAEWFGWMLGWVFVPFIGVYYPIEILPDAMRWVGMALPPSYVFEAVRTLSAGGTPSLSMLGGAFGLACLYVAGGGLVFRHTLKNARKRGSLLNLSD
jgi:ABC-2 type transport system permease protein